MREYYVIRLGRPVDSTKFLPNNNQAMEGVQAPQPAPARGRQERVRLGDNFQQDIPIERAARPTGYYVKQFDASDKSGLIVHSSEQAAEDFAREQAAKHPQVLFGIFSCVKVFETTEPNVVVKTFNDSDELVVNQQ